MHLIGTKGEIVIGNHELELWRTNPEGRSRELVMHPFPQVYKAVSPMVALIRELVETSQGGPPPISSGPTAIEAVRQVVGLYMSSDNGSQRITMAELDEQFDIPSP